MKHFLYIPALSTGGIGNYLVKDKKIFDKIPIRFYSKEYGEFQYPYFLITGGHFYKKPNIIEQMGLNKKEHVIIGDSGGYQIASGALKYSQDLVHKIFIWLENNSNIAINLDIPPRMTLQGKFQESMELSDKNFRYFADNQTGKTRFLNVLQGDNIPQFREWYKMASKYEFNGWAIGGLKGDINKMVGALLVLLENGELHKDKNRFLHILGTTRAVDFLILEQLQKSLHESGSKVQVMSDSSSPGRTAAFGNYYISFNWDTLSYKSLTLSNKTKYKDDSRLVYASKYDKIYLNEIRAKHINEWTSDSYSIITMHNLYFILDVYEKIKTAIYADEENKKQLFKLKIYNLLKSIDELVKAKDKLYVYNKYKQLYSTLSLQEESINKELTDKFFNF